MSSSSPSSNTHTTKTTPPFHRLLSFYSNRNPHDSQTIRFQDSLKGNLALGLDFPVACAVALGRHLLLRNVGLFSLNIFVPKVTWKSTPLEGLQVDDKKDYTCSEIVGLVRGQGLGVMAAVEAAGLWALAADVGTGVLKGGDVEGFKRGSVLYQIEERRRNSRSQVLPVWRGGPISVAGHSWVVGRVFGVEVYKEKED